MNAEVATLKKRVNKLSSLLDVATAMTAERDLNALLQLILREVRQSMEADRCSLYIVDYERQQLWSKIAQGLEIKEIRIPIGVGIAGYVAQTGEKLNLHDVYEDKRFDRSWDIKTGYRTKTMLCVPMLNRDGRVTGVIQAINKGNGEVFTDEDEKILMAIGSQASATIENALLNDDIDRLFEGFVKASVYAIESRDPTTSGHSERVAVLTLGIAESLERAHQAVRFSEAEKKEIRYASLLHDFGKVGVREHVLVKANKLLPLELDLVQMRFQLIKRTAQYEATKKKFDHVCNHGDHAELPKMDAELEAFLAECDDLLRFIHECNKPTVLAEGTFDRLQGLQTRKFLDMNGQYQPFLQEKEIEFLSVRRGSLTLGERLEIESHVVHTYKFLQQIPWTRELKKVPLIAYAHHEKLDGKGYPLHLPAAEIPLQSRMMTVSDIYDALTASDRPYKKAMPHEKALDILSLEAKEGKVDPELLKVFIEANVHEKLKDVQAPQASMSRLEINSPAPPLPVVPSRPAADALGTAAPLVAGQVAARGSDVRSATVAAESGRSSSVAKKTALPAKKAARPAQPRPKRAAKKATRAKKKPNKISSSPKKRPLAVKTVVKAKPRRKSGR